MTGIDGQAAAELGWQLKAHHFRPLPDFNDEGNLVGTRLWRTCAGYVEYVALRSDGLAHAVRAIAQFDYDQPTHHGPLVDHRFGLALNAFDWLIATAPAPVFLRPEVTPNWPVADENQNHPS
jgi:hypothetical protein